MRRNFSISVSDGWMIPERVKLSSREELSMGVAYNVIAAGSVHQYPFAVDCLESFDMVPPTPSTSSRNPSPLELRTVLDELSGYRIEYFVSQGNWQALVEATTGLRLFRPNTLVCVVDFQGDETMPCIFYFEKGDPKLNIHIVEHLSRVCGPFYVFPDTGAQPLLVTTGVDPNDAVKVWEMG
jgi:hypothetical protein